MSHLYNSFLAHVFRTHCRREWKFCQSWNMRRSTEKCFVQDVTWALTYESIAIVVDCIRSNQSKLQQESRVLPMPHPLLSTSFNVDWLRDCGHWKVVDAPVNDPTTPTVVRPAHHARGCEVGKDTCHCLRYWRNWKKCVGDKYVLNAFSIYLHTQTHIQHISCM